MFRYIFIFMLMILSQILSAQISYENVWVDYDSVFEYKNLRFIPVRPKGFAAPGPEFITLKEGMRSGLITVNERGTASTENVHWVRIINHSQLPVYIGSGEVLAGGRQDRLLTRDTLLFPSGRDQYIPAMCIEENRWSEKERKFLHQGFANPRVRRVADISKNQLLIWKEIYTQLDSNKIQSPTLAYLARKLDRKFQVEMNEYLHFFQQKLARDTGIVGFICISGKKILGADIYAFRNLFREQSLEILTGYIEEAMAFGSKPDLRNELVIDYADQLLISEEIQEAFCRKNGMIHRIAGRTVHVTGYGKTVE